MMRSNSSLFVAVLVLMAVVSGCSATKDPVTAPLEAESSTAQAAAEPAATADEVAAVPASPVAGYLEDPAALARGRGIFRSVCAGYCHSTQATDRVASFLFDCGWDYGSSDDAIYRVIADGVPDTQMQAFGGKVPDEDLWKVIAWVRSASKCTDGTS